MSQNHSTTFYLSPYPLSPPPLIAYPARIVPSHSYPYTPHARSISSSMANTLLHRIQHPNGSSTQQTVSYPSISLRIHPTQHCILCPFQSPHVIHRQSLHRTAIIHQNTLNASFVGLYFLYKAKEGCFHGKN